MNIIEAYEALKQGKRVSHRGFEAVFVLGKAMGWKDSRLDVPVMETLIDGWTLIDDAPKNVEFEDCALTMHEDYAETFSYKGTSMYAEKAFRFSNFRGYLWRIKSGRVVCSSMPVLQNPNHEDSFVFQAYSGPDSENWPLAERFAVRFER